MYSEPSITVIINLWVVTPPYITSPGIFRGDLKLRDGTCTDCLVMPKVCLLLKSYPHFRTLKKDF